MSLRDQIADLLDGIVSFPEGARGWAESATSAADKIMTLVETEVTRLTVELAEARRERDLLRAHQYDPGVIVRPAPIGGAWSVHCLACSAPTVVGFPSRQAAEERADLHEHVYPDADGWVDTNAGWPMPQILATPEATS